MNNLSELKQKIDEVHPIEISDNRQNKDFNGSYLDTSIKI